MLDMNKSYTVGDDTRNFRLINFDKLRAERTAVVDGKTTTLIRDHQIAKGGSRVRHLQSLQVEIPVTRNGVDVRETCTINITVDMPSDATVGQIADQVTYACGVVLTSGELPLFLAKES